jgi:hypothetical protein
MALALAKNLSMPPLRAGQSHPFRTNWPNPFPRTNLPVREPEVARLCLAPGISWRAFVAQGRRFSVPSKSCLHFGHDQGSQQLSHALSALAEINIRKYRKINTYNIQLGSPLESTLTEKGGRGLPGFSTRFPLSRPLFGRFLGLAGVATGLVSKGLIMRRKAYIKRVRISHLIRPQTC